MRKLRVAWTSNAPFAPSGYGNITKDMEPLFVKEGFPFALINMYGQMGGIFTDTQGVVNYPIINHQFGSDAMVHHGKHFKADITISLQDAWPLNPQDLAQTPRYIPYLPVDYDPIPKPILHNMKYANRIISMSHFGEKQLSDNGLSSTYIPHGVDTKIFFPMDKRKRKIEIGLNPDTFIFGMVSANKDAVPRKSFQQVMEAFKKFLETTPNSLLYIHTDPDFPGGFPLKQYAEFLGISQNIRFPEPLKLKYDTSRQEMNLIYNTFDVLLQPSSSEGFGIPIIEAQAAGVPVIVNDWTAMPELILDGVTGYKVKPGFRLWFPIGSYMAWPDTHDLYEKMMKIKGMKLDVMGKSATKFAKDNFDLDMLWTDKWVPFLDRIENELYPTP